jgi:tape measure domain-containing protein
MATSVLRTLAVRLRLNSAQFQKDIGKVDRRMKKLSGSMRRSANMFNSQLGALGATFASGFGLGQLKDAADTMVNLRNKMGATYDTSQEVAQGMLDIKRVARESRSDLDSVGTLYQRIAVSTKQMSTTQEEVAAITQVVSNSFLLSGTTASEAANSARQFAQGLASGTLRGDEFRSVSENNVVLTRMLAEGLNKTVGQLRLFSHAGGLTAETMLPILMNNLEGTTLAVTKMRLNIGQATVLFKNNFTEMVDRVNSVFLVTDKTAVMIKVLSDNMHILTAVVAGFATLLLTKVVVGFVSWIALTLTAAVTTSASLVTSVVMASWAVGKLLVTSLKAAAVAVRSLTIAMLANPMVLIIAAVVGVIGAFVLLEQKFQIVERMSKSFKSLGAIATAAFDVVKIGFQKALLNGKIFFSKIQNAIAAVLRKLGMDETADSLQNNNDGELEKQLTKLEAESKAAKKRVEDAVSGFVSPIDATTDGEGMFTGIIDKIKGQFSALMPSGGGEGGEGGMFAGMVESFGAGVDGILTKIVESNPTLAKFWATLKGEIDPDVDAAAEGGATSLADMTWADRWVAAIGRIKDTFKEMGDSANLTITRMIQQYDTFEEVLEKGLKNLKKNSHIRKGIMMREALIAGKKAVLDAYATGGPFPFNLGAAALVAANTALVMRDIMKGQAHDGMDSLPSTGTYMLERGERVVSSRANRDLTEFLASNGKGGSSGSTQPITLQVNGISDPDMVVSALASRRGELEAMMRSIASENTRQSPF